MYCDRLCTIHYLALYVEQRREEGAGMEARMAGDPFWNTQIFVWIVLAANLQIADFYALT